MTKTKHTTDLLYCCSCEKCQKQYKEYNDFLDEETDKKIGGVLNYYMV